MRRLPRNPRNLRLRATAEDGEALVYGSPMIGAGTVINPIIKVLTTVAILGAAYLFIIKPALNAGTEQFEKSQQAAEQRSRQVSLDVARSRLSSYSTSLSSTWPAAAREVRACAQRAGEDADRLDRCVNVSQRLISGVQSNRSFALSYADSLEAQGDDAAAQRVYGCVKEAGFRTAAMHRCRNLADDLLFG